MGSGCDRGMYACVCVCRQWVNGEGYERDGEGQLLI